MLGVIGTLIGLWPLKEGGGIKISAISIAAFFVTASFISPQILRPILTLWLLIGTILGWINSRIILGVVFFSFFLPVRIVASLRGKDSLGLILRKDLDSYWIARPSIHRNVDRFRNQY